MLTQYLTTVLNKIKIVRAWILKPADTTSARVVLSRSSYDVIVVEAMVVVAGCCRGYRGCEFHVGKDHLKSDKTFFSPL